VLRSDGTDGLTATPALRAMERVWDHAGPMALVRVDVSDPTARGFCMACASTWVDDHERCPQCGAPLVTKEAIHRDIGEPEPASLDLLYSARDEDERQRVRGRLEESECPYLPFTDEDGTTHFYIDGADLDWARGRLGDIFRGGDSVLLARMVTEIEAVRYRAALESRGVKYTINHFTRQYPTIGEILIFVAEADLEAAQRAIEEMKDEEAPAQEISAEFAQEDSAPEDSASAQDMQADPRSDIARVLLYSTALVNLIQAAMLYALAAAMYLGTLNLLCGTAFVMLGRWSRRNPESAFAWALLPLVLDTIGSLLNRENAPLVPAAGALTMLAALFAWRRARSRRLERTSPRGGTA